MSEPSTRFIFRYLHHQHISSKTSPIQNPSPNIGLSQLLFHHPKPSINPWSSISHRTHFSSSPSSTVPRIFQNPTQKLNPKINLLNKRNFLGFRYFSFKNSEVGSKINGGFAKNVVPHRTHFSSLSAPTVPRIFQNPTQKFNPQPNLLNDRNFLGFRYFSFKNSELGSKINGGFAKNVFKKPASAIQDVFSRYREAVGLQIEAFWKRNYLLLLGAGGVVVCILLWRILFGVANTFVGLSEGMAKYGFLALSTAIVAFAGLYLRSRFTINPDKVYRMAMRRLNTSAGILEVMGAPLSGTDLRAYVMSGGGISLKHFKPRLRGKRCFLIFPIRGSERKGLVSVEVKNKKGEYDMKLLAVDIPMTTGADQRLFLIGDEEEYRVGGGLISELRDPVVKAMAATKEFEDRDEIEDEEDAERELQEAERRHREEVEKLEKDGS